MQLAIHYTSVCLKCVMIFLISTLFIYLAVSSPGCSMRVFISAKELSSCGVQDQPLWSVDLVALRHIGSQFPNPGLSPHPLIAGWTLNHWTTREVPLMIFKP